jgi:hypothetical protein
LGGRFHEGVPHPGSGSVRENVEPHARLREPATGLRTRCALSYVNVDGSRFSHAARPWLQRRPGRGGGYALAMTQSRQRRRAASAAVCRTLL